MLNKSATQLYTNKLTSFCWIALLVCTVISVSLSFASLGFAFFIISAFFLVAIKGAIVTEFFMELATAPRLWRRLLLAYVTVLPLILMAIYLI